MARMANTTSAEVKAFLLRESRRNLGPSVTTSMFRSHNYVKQFNNSLWPQDYTGKMNSQVVLHSSMFNHSRSL